MKVVSPIPSSEGLGDSEAYICGGSRQFLNAFVRNPSFSSMAASYQIVRPLVSNAEMYKVYPSDITRVVWASELGHFSRLINSKPDYCANG